MTTIICTIKKIIYKSLVLLILFSYISNAHITILTKAKKKIKFADKQTLIQDREQIEKGLKNWNNKVILTYSDFVMKDVIFTDSDTENNKDPLIGLKF